MRLRGRTLLAVVASVVVALVTTLSTAPAYAAVSQTWITDGLRAEQVALSPDGKTVWTTGSSTNVLTGFSATTNQVIHSWTLSTSSFTQFIILPDSSRAIMPSRNAGSVSVVTLATGVETPIPFLNGIRPSTVVLSPDKRFFAVGYAGFPRVSLVRVSDLSLVHEWALTSTTERLVYSPSGSTLVAIEPSGSRISFIDTTNYSTQIVDIPVMQIPKAGVFSADGIKLYIGRSGGNDVDVFNVATKSRLSQIAVPTDVGNGWVDHMALSADGKNVWLAVGYRYWLLDTLSDSLAGFMSLDRQDLRGQSLAFSANGCNAWTPTNEDFLVKWQLKECSPKAALANTGSASQSMVTAAWIAFSLILAGAAVHVSRRKTQN